MPKINSQNTIRTQVVESTKKTSHSASFMQFLGIKSTIVLPETGASNPQLTSKWQNNRDFFHPATLELSQSKPPPILSNELKSIFSAIQKNENTPTLEKLVLSFSSDSDKKFTSNDDLNHIDKPVNSSSTFRMRSKSFPIIPSFHTDETDNVNKSQKTEAVNLIGHSFSPENLMFSESLQKSADKFGVVIGVRYPSEVGQVHLKENHPTKNFHVKAKSSATGPTAGFIAENPKFSKVGPEKWEKQQSYINEALAKGAKLVDLQLSQAQIDNAITHTCMVDIGNNTFSANYHGEEIHFTIGPHDSIVRDIDGKSVRVLTNPPETDGSESINKPITADYDLFSIVAKDNQSVNLRQLEVRHNIKLRRHSLNFNQNENIKDYHNSGGVDGFNKAVGAFLEPKKVHGETDPDRGNTHFFGDVIVDDINKNVFNEGFKGGKLVWHGDETGNPYSPGFDPSDKPVFFIPGQPPQQIFSKNELVAFYSELKNHGFTPESSARLGI